MTWAAPWSFALAGVAAIGIVLLHLLNRDRPPVRTFPTVRFVDNARVQAPTRAPRPNDLLLLLLRIAAIVLLGAAFAQPRSLPATRRGARVILVDQSTDVANPTAALSAAKQSMRPGDVLIPFDSAAHNSSGGLSSRAAGSLSAALLAAIRAAHALSDSNAIVLFSPVSRDEWDAATLAIRAQFAGPLSLQRIPAANVSPATTVQFRGDSTDPLLATLATLGVSRSSGMATIRIVRDTVTGADSAFSTAGASLIYWPAHPTAQWAASDSSDAVAIAHSVTIARFPRVTPPIGTSIAFWSDGSPAATERSLGQGCERDVAITLPASGDVVLRQSVQRLVRMLMLPCGMTAPPAPVSQAMLDSLQQTPAFAGARPPALPMNTLIRWLLVAAAALLLVEMAVRRKVVR